MTEKETKSAAKAFAEYCQNNGGEKRLDEIMPVIERHLGID